MHVIVADVAEDDVTQAARAQSRLIKLQHAGERFVGHAAELDDVTAYLHVERSKQLFRQRATGDARRRLTRRRALQHIAQIARAELLPAREVCMTGARALHTSRPLRRNVVRLRRHHVRPVRPISVLNQQRDGRAERLPMSHTAHDFNAVTLDLHPPAAPVAPLSPRKFAVDQLDITCQTGRQPFNDCDQHAPMRLACGGETKHD